MKRFSALAIGLTLAGACGVFATGAQAAPQYYEEQRTYDYDRDGIPDRVERERTTYRDMGRYGRFDDVAIDRRVTRALWRELGHDAADIDVSVRDGDVVLSGTVDHPIERRRARQVASNVAGVRAVYARNLTVRFR